MNLDSWNTQFLHSREELSILITGIVAFFTPFSAVLGNKKGLQYQVLCFIKLDTIKEMLIYKKAWNKRGIGNSIISTPLDTLRSGQNIVMRCYALYLYFLDTLVLYDCL